MNKNPNLSVYVLTFQLALTFLLALGLAACCRGSGNNVLDTAGAALFTSSPAATAMHYQQEMASAAISATV